MSDNHPVTGEAGADDAVAEDPEHNALLSRLRIIEDQPLESRAASFAQIHEELQSRLESGDAASAS